MDMNQCITRGDMLRQAGGSLVGALMIFCVALAWQEFRFWQRTRVYRRARKTNADS